MTKVLAIDPGTQVVGYAVVDKEGSKTKYIDSGTIRTKRGEEIGIRLRNIYENLHQVLEKHSPDEVALEKTFYGKNVHSAIRMGEGRGVILLLAAQADLALWEYDPTRIKKAVVGAGSAHKTQVQFMVKQILQLTKEVTSDEADALAIAICHCQQLRLA